MRTLDIFESDKQPNYLKRRLMAFGGVALAGMAAMGLLNVGVKAGHDAERIAVALVGSGGPEFTPAQLGSMPQKEVTLAPDEGAEAAAESVDPGLASDAEGLYDVKNYILAQGTGRVDGKPDLQRGQAVQVPVIASEQPSAHK